MTGRGDQVVQRIYLVYYKTEKGRGTEEQNEEIFVQIKVCGYLGKICCNEIGVLLCVNFMYKPM